MTQSTESSQSRLHFPLPPLEVQAEVAMRYGLETLLFCPNAWALRHRFINQETGETIRARCNRWDCLYCGPRKVDQWRQLIKAADPKLFLTLSKAGNTVEEAARALTVFMRSLRRGSKGKGPHHLGPREAYPVEYFGVLERHRNFAENGFHWHLLLKGVDYIPYKEALKPAWISATHGKAEIGHIEAIRRPQAIGYVTKYLTKQITRVEKGVREKQQEMVALGLDDQGNLVQHQQLSMVEVTSRARRIRYSRHFFPEAVSALRARLFSEWEREEVQQEDDSLPLGESAVEESTEVEHASSSPWSLVEYEEATRDRDEYQRRRRAALLEALEDVRAGQRHLSGRVISAWAYQRHELRRRHDD